MPKNTSSTIFRLLRKTVPLPHEGKAYSGCRPMHSFKLCAIFIVSLFHGGEDRTAIFTVSLLQERRRLGYGIVSGLKLCAKASLTLSLPLRGKVPRDEADEVYSKYSVFLTIFLRKRRGKENDKNIKMCLNRQKNLDKR